MFEGFSCSLVFIQHLSSSVFSFGKAKSTTPASKPFGCFYLYLELSERERALSFHLNLHAVPVKFMKL